MPKVTALNDLDHLKLGAARSAAVLSAEIGSPRHTCLSHTFIDTLSYDYGFGYGYGYGDVLVLMHLGI